jgi:hypothetical protein
LSTKNTRLLQVYIEEEDYLLLKHFGSSSRGMGKIVRALIKGYTQRLKSQITLPEIPDDATEHSPGPDLNPDGDRQGG